MKDHGWEHHPANWGIVAAFDDRLVGVWCPPGTSRNNRLCAPSDPLKEYLNAAKNNIQWIYRKANPLHVLTYGNLMISNPSSSFQVAWLVLGFRSSRTMSMLECWNHKLSDPSWSCSLCFVFWWRQQIGRSQVAQTCQSSTNPKIVTVTHLHCDQIFRRHW